MKYTVSTISKASGRNNEKAKFTSLQKAKEFGLSLLSTYKSSNIIQGVNISVEKGCTSLAKYYGEDFWRDYRG